MVLRKISLTWIMVSGVVIIFGAVFLVSQNSKKQASPLPVPATTQLSGVEIAVKWPEATIPFSQRGESYIMYTDNPKDPQILEVVFDPFDVQIGEEQVVIVRVREKGDTITRDTTVTAQMMMDNDSEIISLQLKKVEEPDLSTTWQGSWIATYGHAALYSVIITATGQNGESSVTVSFR